MATKKDPMVGGMTEKQWRVVEWIRTELGRRTERELGLPESKELKSFDVRIDNTRRWNVMVVLTLGYKVKSVFDSDELFMYAIGPQGGAMRLDSEVTYKGHPVNTWFLPRTKKDRELRDRLRRERVKNAGKTQA